MNKLSKSITVMNQRRNKIQTSLANWKERMIKEMLEQNAHDD